MLSDLTWNKITENGYKQNVRSADTVVYEQFLLAEQLKAERDRLTAENERLTKKYDELLEKYFETSDRVLDKIRRIDINDTRSVSG